MDHPDALTCFYKDRCILDLTRDELIEALVDVGHLYWDLQRRVDLVTSVITSVVEDVDSAATQLETATDSLDRTLDAVAGSLARSGVKVH